MYDRLIIKQMKEIWDASGKSKNPMEAIHFLVDGKPADERIYDDIADEVSNRLSLNKDDNLLEVGCGNGLLIKRLENRVKSITGIDISLEMLKGIKNTTTNVCQAEAGILPFHDYMFDKVVSHSIFHYFPDLEYAENAVMEMLRVCKPGGQILISDILNGYLEEIYIKMTRKVPFKKKLKNLLRPYYYKIKGKSEIKHHPLFIEPMFFKNMLSNGKNKAYMLLETVESKPRPFLMFRYDVLIFRQANYE
jgi:ubiquinone/menaquinone biosynthesis C-methylase UbiE